MALKMVHCFNNACSYNTVTLRYNKNLCLFILTVIRYASIKSFVIKITASFTGESI
jgi:hypothetical protein